MYCVRDLLLESQLVISSSVVIAFRFLSCYPSETKLIDSYSMSRGKKKAPFNSFTQSILQRHQSNYSCWGSTCANTFPTDKLHSSSISKLYLNASKDGVFARTACRHFGSPSWEITRVSSWAEMASNKTGSSSYSSGEVKWSFKQRISVSKWDKKDIVLCLARLRNIGDLNISGFVLVPH